MWLLICFYCVWCIYIYYFNLRCVLCSIELLLYKVPKTKTIFGTIEQHHIHYLLNVIIITKYIIIFIIFFYGSN